MHKVFDHSVSCTTDLGTEFAVPDFRLDKGDMDAVLPVWLKGICDDGGLEAEQGLQPDLSDSDIEADGARQCDDRNLSSSGDSFLFTQAYRIPGVLHIIHNAILMSSDKLIAWPSFEKYSAGFHGCSVASTTKLNLSLPVASILHGLGCRMSSSG